MSTIFCTKNMAQYVNLYLDKTFKLKFFVKIIIIRTGTIDLTEFYKPVADELAARCGSLKRVLSAVKIEPQGILAYFTLGFFRNR